MTDLSESNSFTAAITRIEANDIALGGNEINAPNLQLKQLTDRTRWLKGQVDTLLAGLTGLTIGEDVQAWDPDLDAIAALTGTGLIRRTGNGTAALVSPWVNNSVCQGRLTLTTGSAVTTADVAAATTVYFTPYGGNLVALYTGSEWVLKTFSERSLSLSGLSANTNYDLFLYDNAGTLTLEATAWSSATARATALVLQDGVWVRSSAASRRYLGTIRITGTIGQCEDSVLRRFVWNVQNQEPRLLLKWETADWTYAVAGYRPLNNSTANRIEFVIGLTTFVQATFTCHLNNFAFASIALDSTTAPDTNSTVLNSVGGSSAVDAASLMCNFQGPLLGHHYLQAIESAASGTANFYGTVAGGGKYTGLQMMMMG